MKLTFWEFLMDLFGYGYVVNHRSREIHKLSDKSSNCKLELIADHNREYISKSRALKLINKMGYNGCRWCWDEQDKG